MKLFVVSVAIAALSCTATASASYFRSPSRNLDCYIDKTAARCDIRKRDWEPPRRPAWCQLDYGFGLLVHIKGPGHFLCAGDTARHPGARILRYGESIERGRFRCTSKRSGMKCVNERTGHGFKLSKRRPIRW
jgi:hypothetical protein